MSLVVLRKQGQAVHVGGPAVVTMQRVKGNGARLRIAADPWVPIVRHELTPHCEPSAIIAYRYDEAPPEWRDALGFDDTSQAYAAACRAFILYLPPAMLGLPIKGLWQCKYGVGRLMLVEPDSSLAPAEP